MSRAINTSLATIQFQVNARQASAAMQALQNMSNDLNREIDKVKKNINNLGENVPADNPQLLNYQQQLRGLESQLKDVQKAQRDFLKGAKAADQLWKAASEGTIESLSFRSIKAGVNGLKKRQEGLSPGDAQDMKDWRIIKQVIDEADRVMKQAGADVQNVVQTIREGGKVSEQAMRQTISTLKELKGSVDETDAEYRTYGNDLDFMEAKLQEFSEAQRRAKGEIVDANDARREMNKLTEEGAAAAKREAETAERKIAALHGEREELMAQREQIKQNVAATQEQIDKNHELIEEKHRQLAADEHAHNVIQDANHAHIEGLKTQAEAERKLANEKSDAAETHRRAAELQKQTTEQLTEKVTELQGKLAALNAEPVKPKVDTSEIERLNAELKEIRSRRSQIESARTLLNDQMETLTGKGSRRGSSVLFKDYENGIFHKDQLKVYIDQLNAAYKKIGPQKENETFQAYYERLGKEAFPDMKGVLSQFRDWEHLIRSICSQVTDLSGELKAIPNMSGAGTNKRFDGFDLQKGYTTARQDANKLKKDNEELLSEYIDLGTKEFDIEQQIIDAKKQSITATKNEAQATKQESQELEQIELKLKNIANLRKEQQKIIDDYEAKYGKTSDEQYEARHKIELEASQKDVAAQEAAVEKVNKKWDNFWKKQEEAAQEFARSLGKSLDEIAPEDITSEQLSGPLAKSAQAAYKVTARRDYEFSEALGREGKLTEYKETARRYEGDDSPEAKVIESLTRKYREYVKELNEATTSDAEAKKVRSELREESDAYVSALGQMQGFQKVENDLLQQKDGILKQTAETSKQSAETQEQSNEKSEEELRLKGELEEAQGKLAESKKRENEEQQEYVKLQGEAIEQGNKAAAAETKLADAQSEATQKQADFNQKQQEGLDTINQVAEGNKALQTTLEGQEQQLKDNSDAVRKNAEETTAAEQEKAQARQLSIKRMEEMLAALQKEYREEELTSEQREKKKAEIKELDEAIRIAKDEWMSYADAEKYAASIGVAGFMGTDQQNKMATDALTRHREELVKTIQQKEADGQATATERAELEKLDQALMKVRTGFASADEVMARWAEHMNAGKTASESMAQTLDEKLAGATSSFDKDIEDAIKDIADYDEELKKAETRLADLEQQMEQATNKAKNRSGIGRALFGDSDRKKIYDLQLKIEGDEGYFGAREDVEEMKRWKQSAQDRLDWLKQQKAEELGLTESEVQAEEKKADAKRLTNEQMQEGIKLLEEEYAKTDHTTEEGIKRREQLREAIGQMNQELKESTGEWMKLADAEKLAEQARKDTFLNKEGKGFIASPEEIQKATQALERRRDALIKNMKTSGEATKEQERELADLTKKIKDLKFEQDNLNMSQEKMQMLMRTPTNAVSLDELRAAIKRADGELKRMEGSLGQNNAQYKAFAEQVRNAKNQLKEMEGQAKATSTAWEKAWSRLKTYVGMYMGFNMAWQKVTGTADDLLELSDKMGEVRKTTGFTADEVGRLSDNLAKLDTRTSLTGLMEFSSLAGSIGMKTQEQVQGFTEAANMLAVSLPEMGNEASRTLIKIADATGDLEKNGGNVRETLERVGSTIIALRANSAAAAGPITDFVSRVGAVGAQAGISIDQIAALGATVDALGGRVEMSATALSRMIPAIKNNTFEVAKAIGMTEKELKNMTGMEQMVAIFRKLHDSTKGFDTSTEEGMNAMADSVEKALGRSTSMQEVMKELNQQGARAGIVFGLLSQNVDKLEEQLDTASEAYSKNVALMNEYSKMNDTAAAKWARLKNQIEEFFVTAGNTSWLGSLIDKLRIVVDLLTDEGPIGSFFRYSLVYLILLKAKWAETFGSMLISVGKFLFATKASTAASAADTAAKTAEAAATEAVGNASADASVKTGLFAKAWGKMNAAMRANIITAVAMAVYFLGSKLMDVAKKSKEAAQRIDQVADAEKKAKEESIKERAELEKLYKITQDQNKSLKERKKALHDMVGDERYNQYYKNLANESELAKAAAYEYSNLTAEIIKSAKARAYQQKITELTEKNLALEEKRDEAKKYVDDNKASYERVSTNVANSPTPAGMFGMAAAAAQESNDGRRKFLRDYEARQQDIITNQEEMKKNDADILKLETKINELNLKSSGGGDDGGSGGGGGGGGSNNPYGDYDRVKDPYEKWDANDLVARRKEMLERVRALANGADVQKVLSEDAKFISDAVRKNIKTTSDAIEWYNTERLKIQEALHGKHLTNTGDWMDPKQQKIRRKLMQDDMKAYLEELDAYYTDRKTEIDRARNDEEISEAEAWNRNIKNEAEWHRRRAELQIMYSNKHKQIAEDEQNTISAIIAERTGDDAKYIKATISNTRKFSEAVKAMNDQGAKEYRKFQGDLDLGSEKDWNKVEKALTRHLKAIEEIVNKERPFNGIAKNMQDNLGKMGILTADLTEGADSAAEELKRITFLLGEAENAYTMTVENLLDDMRQNGFKEWADVVSKDPSMQQGLLAMLRQTFDSVQDAIKKESSIIKKQVEIMMQDITEQVQADTTRMQILQNSVQRANQLIGAGPASERVADKLAIKQTQLQITLQETRIRMLKKAGADRVALLMQEADLLDKQGKVEEAKQKRMDAENVNKSVGLTLTKEQVELDKQRVSLSEKLEESQNRLYTSLREWADLLTSSLQGVFEASHAGDAEYYNERAKLELTGKGGPGAGTYMVIENEGTEDAKAHYEYLDERQALEREHEIEVQNAQADAWRKLMDDLNNKMSEQITDWINASMQNQAVEANTNATVQNTEAIIGLTGVVQSNGSTPNSSGISDAAAEGGMSGGAMSNPAEQGLTPEQVAEWTEALGDSPMLFWSEQSDLATQNMIANMQATKKAQQETSKAMTQSAQSSFAKMSYAANMYGLAYQTMSNDNLDASEKFQMFALQAAGQAAIGMLTANLIQTEGQTQVELPGILGKAASQLGPIAGPIAFAAMMALLGGLMGMAVSKVSKSKSQIAQITGASVSAGRLSTGMLTYAEGNVNEFTDPATLTPGRHYNVDGADGRTYRAKYTGKNAKTHITSGPEFHLVGEKGREAIIDAHTTRNIQMNDPEIWRSIQTLYNGGRITNSRVRRGRGVSAFADGNLDDFEDMTADGGGTMADSGLSPEMIQGFQSSLDRNSAVMERIEANGIHAYFDVYGKGGLVDSYDTGKKTAKSHGEKY